MSKSFNENLKYAMDCKDIHTKELAALTGIKADTISSYLKSNGSEPTVSKALKIADALGVSVNFLVTGEGDKPKKSIRPDVEQLLRKLNALPEDYIKIIAKLLEIVKPI